MHISCIQVKGGKRPDSQGGFLPITHLIRNRNKVVARGDLLAAVWEDVTVAPRTIEPHIVYLRRKIEKDPAHPEHILNVRGVGYRFRE